MRNFQAAILLALLSAPLQAEIFSVFSDKGISGTNAFVWGSGVFEGTSTAVSPPEGYSSWRTQTGSSAGWGVFYSAPQDLSRFVNGQIIFWLRSDSTATFNVEIEFFDKFPTGTKLTWQVAVPQAQVNQWGQVPLLLDLSGLPPPYNVPPYNNLTNLKGVFLVTAMSPCTFYVDRVRYKTSQAVFEMNVAANHVVGGGTAPPDPVFTPGTLPKSWVMADQYLTVEIDPNNQQWGLQIYTDNTALAASPRFTSPVASGQPGSNPAGLVDTSTTTKRLPTAWKIQAEVSTNTVAAGDPNSGVAPGFGWLFMKDKATPTIASENTTFFQNGEPYATVADNRGIHFGPQNSDFGAENVSYRIYLQANFATAVTPRTYRTNQLILEYYNP